ncbi:TetR/AcrR family transcriptional regulator [Amycolatopsis sp. PS_44_ISF1]|uniref:TetR/AcrR family transcriptional regulator n=1 Tax=Amycolatopsis sp. PS_44_ISF1 TaxID=2974917 RepID=UPI0028DF088A|nr:TetR/AcrR family transcriptional regulator [Amycolatopsis sp. PS_44_ISF1]MDT8914731.1 TetR/AcrR family transcriptional regulator [Amycolatopsis sp. PS_44_ISF1]
MSERQTQILQAAVRVLARDGVRGLRVDRLAAEAGVSTALIYYHFKDRAGLLRHALDHINERAVRYTAPASADPRTQLEQVLLNEVQDTGEVRENSIAWGELRASAVFADELRDRLRAGTQEWSDDVSALIRAAQAAGRAKPEAEPDEAAERLTALVEGLSERWLSGSITAARARELLSGAVVAELGPPR